MLSGENAFRRYNGYLITAYHRMRKVDARALDAKSYEGKLVAAAYVDELEIVSDYVNEVYADSGVTYDDVAGIEKRSFAWTVFIGTGGHKAESTRAQIVSMYGKKYLKTLRRLIRFRVALATCERYRAGLGSWLSARDDFTWNDFAKIVKRLAPVREPDDVSLAGIPGVEWGK
jgi:hypothetical protein